MLTRVQQAILQNATVYAIWLRVKIILIAFDCLLNVLAPASTLGMTISAHAAMAAADKHPWGTLLSKFLDLFERHHCRFSMMNDYRRAQNVIKELEPYFTADERKTLNLPPL